MEVLVLVHALPAPLEQVGGDLRLHLQLAGHLLHADLRTGLLQAVPEFLSPEIP